ncbi:MAG: radical SAM protein [Methanomassiliicoccales archaeon]|nr:radical SAM protein [Methanomassiliicoccales archaeon]
MCSYRLREDFKPSRFLSLDEVLESLSSYHLETMNVIGGEPMTVPDLEKIVRYAKSERRAKVRIAHSNASIMPPDGVDDVGVSLRAFSKRKHQQLTGAQNTKVLSNIFRMHDKGIRLKITTILIPEMIDVKEIEDIAKFVSQVGSDVPLHITGYIPVPGLPWRRPNRDEMADAVIAAKKHMSRVTCSILSVREYISMSDRDSLHYGQQGA